MSADNWDKCPRCLRQALAVLENLKRQVNAAYGVVPVAEFDEKRVELSKEYAKLEDDTSFRTFREDYEIYGAEDGVVNVSYSGQCTVCKLSLKFTDSHPIPGA